MPAAQEPTENPDSTTARTSSVRASVLQKFTFLAAKMTNTHVGNTQGPSLQEQLDKYDGAPVIWRNQWQAILDGS